VRGIIRNSHPSIPPLPDNQDLQITTTLYGRFHKGKSLYIKNIGRGFAGRVRVIGFVPPDDKFKILKDEEASVFDIGSNEEIGPLAVKFSDFTGKFTEDSKTVYILIEYTDQLGDQIYTTIAEFETEDSQPILIQNRLEKQKMVHTIKGIR
jgi:hypothetical protein